MFRRIEPNIGNATAMQRVMNEHYKQLDIWTPLEVDEHIANPANRDFRQKQLDRLQNPESNDTKGGNLTPVYAGLFIGAGAMALKGFIKMAPYKPRTLLRRSQEPYLNIHELAVSNLLDQREIIGLALDFAVDEMGLSREVIASAETFAVIEEIAAYVAEGFRVVDENKRSYDFGTTTSQWVHKLEKEDLIRKK